jgi:hypothetical protein
MTFRRGDGGPSVSNPKGSVKFWIEGGMLTKYQYKVSGLMNWNGNEMDIDRETTVVIQDVGTTRVDVPQGARSKLSP